MNHNKVLKAIEHGTVDAVKQYLDRDSGLLANYGSEFINCAITFNRLDILHYLHDIGADMTGGNNSSLLKAIFLQNLEIVQFLHYVGVRHQYAVHEAARCANLDIVKYLHTVGYDIFATDYDECTPLLLAAESGYINIVEYLHCNSADFFARDPRMANCEYVECAKFAASAGHLEVLRYFLHNYDYHDTFLHEIPDANPDIVEEIMNYNARIIKVKKAD